MMPAQIDVRGRMVFSHYLRSKKSLARPVVGLLLERPPAARQRLRPSLNLHWFPSASSDQAPAHSPDTGPPPKFRTSYRADVAQGKNSHTWSIGAVLNLCAHLWRYFHLMGSPILTLWGHGQSKSLFLLPCHFHVMGQRTGGTEESVPFVFDII